MITELEGELVGSGIDWVDLKLVGVTVRVFVPENTVDGRNLTNGLLRVYTVFVIKDDSPVLYGFKDSETRSVFDSLNKVGGIGPKLALSILSKFDYNSLTVAVESGDVDSLSQVPGVGKRTASRIMLELSGKLQLQSDSDLETAEVESLVQALTSLGYSNSEVFKVINSGNISSLPTVEEKIRACLEILSAGG
ncbi:MAG: Holliday junction branch migration protein RuvA [SAR202 cluster bacterium]|nr:Holliday junction branch migration protein RuvA [Chloroflexota bacterium]MQG38462.1 Holliday junction branch migration protein RuvA [SAR202 cluster bacterium]|tara:strand:+ start:1851 stop:2429 length:579 start_codon:yes stop_codon:yes gene_type:complete